MPVSLNNKRNTRVVENMKQIPGSFPGHVRCVGRTLLHHGHETCAIDTSAPEPTVTINLCGWDTVTTRGKIAAFLARYGYRDLTPHRVKGVTVVQGKPIPVNRPITFRV